MLLSIEEPAPTSAAPQWRAFLELGFRPLYLLGCAWALISIVLWVYMPRMLSAPLGGVFWHAHEMLWGFIITIAVGFLFTAAATWTGITPLKGRALGWACVLWIIARVAFLLPFDAAFWVGVVAETAFFGWATLALANAIYRAKSQRNYGVPLLMLAMGASNLLFLLSIWQGEYDDIMRYFRTGMVGMAVVALLVARRVIPFFAMRAVSGLDIPMHLESGRWQLSAGGAAILFTALDFQVPAAVCLALSGSIALWQLLSWKPQAVLHKPILWILYAGYAGMGLGLMVAALWAAGWIERPVWFVHLIGIAGFSVLIIGMVTRTALGHLGRPLQTDRSMVFCYWAMLASALLRMLALAVEPPFTTPLLHSAGLAWMLCFGVYLWRFIPMLIRPRVDELPGAGKHRVIRPNMPLNQQRPN